MKIMNKLFSAVVLVSAISASFTSCGTVMYMAPMPSAPLLEEKGDFSADIHVEIPSTIIPFEMEADASYAITDHIAIQGSGQYLDKDQNYEQLGAGYFMKIREKQVFEAYLTAGAGRQINRPNESGTSDTEYTKFSYQQYCIQANYGWKNLTQAHIDCGFALRTGLMHYNMYGTTDDIEKVNLTRNIPIAEPMLFFRLGSKAVKLQLEVSYTTLSDHASKRDVPRLICSPLNYTLGLNFNF